MQRFDVLPSVADPNAPLIINPRHKAHLESAARFLDAFLSTGAALRHGHKDAQDPDDGAVGPFELQGDLVSSAEELRYAAHSIGKISGSIGVEEVLDMIFRDFCIGK